MMRSKKFMALLATVFLAAPALAQQAQNAQPPPAAPAPEAAAATQSPLDEAQQKYQQAMMECYKVTVPQHDPSSGEPPDPAAYRMDSQKMQKISKCLADKGVGTPLNPNVQKMENKYFRKGVRNSQAGRVTLQTEAVKARVSETMERMQEDAYERVYGKPPPAPLLKAAQPAAGPKPPDEKTEQPHEATGAGTYNPVSGNSNAHPGIYNATANPAPAGGGGGNNNNGGGSLWVPQSQ